jgi:hypothetical protein
MSNPSGTDHDATESAEATAPVDNTSADEPATDSEAAERRKTVGSDAVGEGTHDHPQSEALSLGDGEPTVVLARPSPPRPDLAATQRRFTAPSGFDAGSTEKIDTAPDPETEVFSAPTEPSAVPVGRAATPQSFPPRPGAGRSPRGQRSWGWVLALILVIAALAAVAIMGTVLLTHKAAPRESQEDMVRLTIQDFDVAVQKGDLAALRGITCGTTSDNYVSYDDKAWEDTHARVAAAKQYPVVASVDRVIVNGDYAEANVTSFMAYAPQTRFTRSFDLQDRDGQWKICPAPGS